MSWSASMTDTPTARLAALEWLRLDNERLNRVVESWIAKSGEWAGEAHQLETRVRALEEALDKLARHAETTHDCTETDEADALLARSPAAKGKRTMKAVCGHFVSGDNPAKLTGCPECKRCVSCCVCQPKPGNYGLMNDEIDHGGATSDMRPIWRVPAP